MLLVFSGERYDFVLNANQPVGNYWVYAVGLWDCRKSGLIVNAILRYNGAPDEDPEGDPSKLDASGIVSVNPFIFISLFK